MTETMSDRTEQEAWEDAELLPDMTDDARRWFLAERERRTKQTTPAMPRAPERRKR